MKQEVRKQKIKDLVKKYRKDFDEEVYFVELSNRHIYRLNILSEDLGVEKTKVLSKLISISLTHTNKTKSLLMDYLELNEKEEEV